MTNNEEEISWEESMAIYREEKAKAQEEKSDALKALAERKPLTEKQMEDIEIILSIRKSNILNLCGIIDEYVEMPCESLFAKFHDATKRYGKLI